MRTLGLISILLFGSLSLQAAEPNLETVISLQAAKLKAAEAKISELETATAVIPTLQTQIAQLQAANAAIPSLQSQLSQLQNSLTMLKADVANNATRVDTLHNAQQTSIVSLTNSINAVSSNLNSNYYNKVTSDQRYLLSTAFQSVLDRCFIQLGHSDRNFNGRENLGVAAKRDGEWKYVQLSGNVNEDDRIWFRFWCP